MTKNQLVRELLSDLTINELQQLVALKRHLKPIPTTRKQSRIPIPTPRRGLPSSTVNVKQMIQNYEDNIIQPPVEYWDKPISTLRIKKKNPANSC